MSQQRKWTPDETAALLGLDLSLSVAELTAAFNAIAADRGWPARTAGSIRRKRQAAGAALNRQRWSAAELAQLDDLVGDRSLQMVCKDYNAWAKKHGYSRRSHKAIHRKASRLGLDTRAQGTWIHSGTAARMLGKCSGTIGNWVGAGWVRRRGNNWQSALHRDDLRRLARKRPRLFGGIPWDDLFWVLEDAKLVDEILQQYPRRCYGPNRTREVVCLTTGKRFSSVREAAKATHVSLSALHKGLKFGYRVAGMEFRHAT